MLVRLNGHDDIHLQMCAGIRLSTPDAFQETIAAVVARASKLHASFRFFSFYIFF